MAENTAGESFERGTLFSLQLGRAMKPRQGRRDESHKGTLSHCPLEWSAGLAPLPCCFRLGSPALPT